MHRHWNRPTQIYLRVWPRQPYERTYQGLFRWQPDQDQSRQELRVTIARRHADIPMAPLHYRMWDELRADIALGQRSGDQVWPGLSRDSDDQWCQDHAFCVIMSQDRMSEVISLHHNRWIGSGRTKRNPDTAYQDWTFDSRRLLDMDKISVNTQER